MVIRANIRPADELLVPALNRTLAALDPPPEDDALVAAALTVARAIDQMPENIRPQMLAQTSGQFLKLVEALDERARRRGRVDPKKPSKLDELRATAARRHA